MRIAILLAALPSAAPWCQHRERDGRILECLRAKIPAFTPLDEVRACFAPCMIAAYGSLDVPVPARAAVVPSLARYRAMLELAPSWRVSPSHKPGQRLRAATRGLRNVVVRCPADNFNLCLRPENADADAVLDQVAANLTGRAAFWHMDAFKLWPQEGGDAATLRPLHGVTYYSTNPAFHRHDVVPAPLGVLDALVGGHLAKFSSRRVAPKPEEVIDWEAELRPISLDGWLGRRRLLHCDSYRMRWGGGGHSYGRQRMLEAFEASGFACDPTPVNHTAYVDGLRESQFVACPRGNGIQVYRVWEALLLGAVPIVLRTHFPTHDALYAKLPVVMIGPSTARPKFDAWTTVTPDFLRRERARIDRLARENAFDLAGAFLPYWLGRLFNESLP